MNGKTFWVVIGIIVVILTGSIKYTHSVEQSQASKGDLQRIEDRLEVIRVEQREDTKEMKQMLDAILRDVMTGEHGQ